MCRPLFGGGVGTVSNYTVKPNKQNKTVVSARESGEHLEVSHVTVGNAKSYDHFLKMFGSSYKVK